MKKSRESSLTIRGVKVFFTLVVLGLVLFISSRYFGSWQDNIEIRQPAIRTLKEQKRFPIYPGARLNVPMCQTGNPYIYVFLSKDRYESIVDFYNEVLKGRYRMKKIEYRKMMTIYQFRSIEVDKKFNLDNKNTAASKQPGEEERRLLEDFIFDGVEIIPLNHLWEKVLEAKTKIKIIIPRNVLLESDKSAEKSTGGNQNSVENRRTEPESS